MTHSVLTDPTITIRGPGRGPRRTVSVPDLLADLGRPGVVGDYPRVRAHQVDPLHQWTAQIAALAMRRSRLTDPRQTADTWRGALVALAGGDAGAFDLVADPRRPAFMQPPAAGLSPSMTKTSPDQIDIVSTSRGHEVKGPRTPGDDIEHWTLALIACQTFATYGGRGLYGSARNRDAVTGRASFGYSPGPLPGDRWRHDVRILLDTHDTVADRHGYRRDGGRDLLWMVPWDGKTQIAPADCDPWVIEVTRIIRLKHDGAGGLVAMRAATTGPRVGGLLPGDPWGLYDKTGRPVWIGRRGISRRMVISAMTEGGAP